MKRLILTSKNTTSVKIDKKYNLQDEGRKIVDKFKTKYPKAYEILGK